MARYSEVDKVYKKEKDPFFWTRICISLFFLPFAVGWALNH